MFNEKFSKMAWRCVFCIAAVVVVFAAVVAGALAAGGIAAVVIAGDLYYSIYRFRHLERQSMVEYVNQSLVATLAVAVLWSVFPAATVAGVVLAAISRLVGLPTLIIGVEDPVKTIRATAVTSHAPSYKLNEEGNIELTDPTDVDTLGAATGADSPKPEAIIQKLEEDEHVPEVKVSTFVAEVPPEPVLPEDEAVEMSLDDFPAEANEETPNESDSVMVSVSLGNMSSSEIVDRVITLDEIESAIKEADESSEKQS